MTPKTTGTSARRAAHRLDCNLVIDDMIREEAIRTASRKVDQATYMEVGQGSYQIINRITFLTIIDQVTVEATQL